MATWRIRINRKHLVQSKVKTINYNVCKSNKNKALYLNLISKAVLIVKFTASNIFINTEKD